MTFGINVFDASGNLVLDNDSLYGRIRYRFVAAAGSSGSVSLPDVNTSNAFSFAVPNGNGSQLPGTSVYNGGVSWTGSSTGLTTSECEIIVVKYRQ